MGYYNTFLVKRIKLWGHQTNYLSGGPNLTTPPYISCIILYNKLKVDNFGHFNDAPFLWSNSALKC